MSLVPFPSARPDRGEDMPLDESSRSTFKTRFVTSTITTPRIEPWLKLPAGWEGNFPTGVGCPKLMEFSEIMGA